MKKYTHISTVLLVFLVGMILSSCNDDNLCVVPSDNNSIDAPKGSLVNCDQLQNIYADRTAISPLEFTYDSAILQNLSFRPGQDTVLDPIWKRYGEVTSLGTDTTDIEYKILSRPKSVNPSDSNVTVVPETGRLRISNLATWDHSGVYTLQATGIAGFVGTVVTEITIQIEKPRYIKVNTGGEYLDNQSKNWASDGTEEGGTKWSCVYDTETELYWTVHESNNTRTFIIKNSDNKDEPLDATAYYDYSGNRFIGNNRLPPYCNKENWRVPEISELKSIVTSDFTATGDKIDYNIDVFPDINTNTENTYWSTPLNRILSYTYPPDIFDVLSNVLKDNWDKKRAYVLKWSGTGDNATTETVSIGENGGDGESHRFRFVSGSSSSVERDYYKIAKAKNGTNGTRIEKEFVDLQIYTADDTSAVRGYLGWPKWVWKYDKITTGKAGKAGVNKTFYTNDEMNANGLKWDCVYDSRSGLYWEIKADAGTSSGRANDATFSPVKNEDGTLKEPLTDAINAEKLCGFTDWQVPTIDDLKTLYDENLGMKIRLDYFPDAAYMFYNTKKGAAIGIGDSISFLSRTTTESGVYQVMNFGYCVSDVKKGTCTASTTTATYSPYITNAAEGGKYYIRMVRKTKPSP